MLASLFLDIFMVALVFGGVQMYVDAHVVIGKPIRYSPPREEVGGGSKAKKCNLIKRRFLLTLEFRTPHHADVVCYTPTLFKTYILYLHLSNVGF